MNLRRLLLMVGLALALAGCSAIQLAYNNADWWLARKVDGYLDLDDDQWRTVRAALQERLEQHRREELVEVVRLLDRTERSLADGLTVAEGRALLERLERALRVSVHETLPLAVSLLTNLDTRQIDHLEQRLAERNRERRREERLDAAPRQRFQARVEELVERIEHWTGDLSARQLALLKAHVETWPDTGEAWQRYHAGRQQALLARLRAGADPAAVERFLHQWLDLADRPVDLQRGGQRLREGLIHLLVALDETLSSGQRARALQQLADYRQSLAGLLPAGERATLADNRTGREVGFLD